MSPDNLHQTQEAPRSSDNTPCDTEKRTLSLLQEIQAGAVDPKCIRPAERRLVVSYLIADGYCTAEMAQILKISDRSIERDKKAICEANALSADPKLVEQMVGRLVCEANLSIQRIRKAARDKGTKTEVKVDAEHRCYQIVSDMIASLQRLGYLPMAASRLQADLTHHVGQLPDFAQLQGEVQRLKRITSETKGTDPTVKEQLNEIEDQLGRTKLANQIESISNIIENKEIQNESDQ